MTKEIKLHFIPGPTNDSNDPVYKCLELDHDITLERASSMELAEPARASGTEALNPLLNHDEDYLRDAIIKHLSDELEDGNKLLNYDAIPESDLQRYKLFICIRVDLAEIKGVKKAPKPFVAIFYIIGVILGLVAAGTKVLGTIVAVHVASTTNTSSDNDFASGIFGGVLCAFIIAAGYFTAGLPAFSQVGRPFDQLIRYSCYKGRVLPKPKFPCQCDKSNICKELLQYVFRFVAIILVMVNMVYTYIDDTTSMEALFEKLPEDYWLPELVRDIYPVVNALANEITTYFFQLSFLQLMIDELLLRICKPDVSQSNDRSPCC